MCTVTVLTTGDGKGGDIIRLACNRDEQRTRPPALPPTHQPFGRNGVLLPIDPVSGGTWIAATSAGLIFVLMNSTPPGGVTQSRPTRSRGAIIPALLHQTRREVATTVAMRLMPEEYPPFRLLVLDATGLDLIRSTTTSLAQQSYPRKVWPLVLSSSGLGDHLVEAPRESLFREMIAGAGNPAEVQDAFHRHHWPDRPQLSVCMRRADARTVSHTLVELRDDAVVMHYHAGAPDEPAESSTLQLPLDTVSA